jgi:hypothetical protein
MHASHGGARRGGALGPDMRHTPACRLSPVSPPCATATWSWHPSLSGARADGVSADLARRRREAAAAAAGQSGEGEAHDDPAAVVDFEQLMEAGASAEALLPLFDSARYEDEVAMEVLERAAAAAVSSRPAWAAAAQLARL